MRDSRATNKIALKINRRQWDRIGLRVRLVTVRKTSSSLPKRQVALLLVILTCLAGSLFLVFNFVASVEVGEVSGLGLFLVAAGLLVLAYMVGLIFLTVAGFSLLLVLGAHRRRGVASGHA